MPGLTHEPARHREWRVTVDRRPGTGVDHAWVTSGASPAEPDGHERSGEAQVAPSHLMESRPDPIRVGIDDACVVLAELGVGEGDGQRALAN